MVHGLEGSVTGLVFDSLVLPIITWLVSDLARDSTSFAFGHGRSCRFRGTKVILARQDRKRPAEVTSTHPGIASRSIDLGAW